jgi:type I restriction enzyme R subunit
LARLGPTGTPLIAGEEERTQKVFGDYVSIYDFSRSIEDGATVPHYDENPIPELQLTNKDLNGYMEELLEADELVDAQERLLERKFACEYHLMTREDRLETIAEDLVQHFATAQKANRAYAHIYDSYFGAGRSAYEDAAV